MFCKNCGANLPEGTTFCSSCGAKQDAPAATPGASAGGYNPQPGYSTQLNLTNIAIGNVKGMRLLGLIVMAILFIFSITSLLSHILASNCSISNVFPYFF